MSFLKSVKPITGPNCLSENSSPEALLSRNKSSSGLEPVPHMLVLDNSPFHTVLVLRLPEVMVLNASRFSVFVRL